MTPSLIVSALCLLLVGTLVGVRAVRAARERHWLGGRIRGLVALLLLAPAALAATLPVGLPGYRPLGSEEVAATVRGAPAGDIRGTRLPAGTAGAARAGPPCSLRRRGCMLVLKLVQSLIKALHSEGTPGQLAAGLALGSILGLTPLWNLHNAVVFALMIVLNVSFAGAMLGWALFVPV